MGPFTSMVSPLPRDCCGRKGVRSDCLAKFLRSIIAGRNTHVCTCYTDVTLTQHPLLFAEQNNSCVGLVQLCNWNRKGTLLQQEKRQELSGYCTVTGSKYRVYRPKGGQETRQMNNHSSPTADVVNVSFLVLQFSPVRIIPLLLHTHSSIYHPTCIMFFSQHSSFPLSVSFHHCYILHHQRNS